jgi:hypothetical protein
MSSPASRRRQRQRRRASDRVGKAQAALAERHDDLVSYERVVADMDRRYAAGELSPFSGAQALALVKELRDATRDECRQLESEVKILKDARAKLEPASTTSTMSAPQESVRP